MTNTSTALLIATMAALAPVSAGAQVRGIPVYNSGVPSGLALAGEFGAPNHASGGGIAYGASVRLGFGPLGVTAMGIRSDPSGTGGNSVGVGATGNLKLIGGPLIPLSVTLQGGAGYARNHVIALPGGGASADPITEWRFPVGVGIAMTLPNPVLAIKPWIAPRVDIVHAGPSGASATSTAFAISGGIEFNLLSGLGLHTGYDWSKRDGITYGTFGVGLHYALRIAGL
jgi:opacity protein-like surface antigen